MLKKYSTDARVCYIEHTHVCKILACEMDHDTKHTFLIFKSDIGNL